MDLSDLGPLLLDQSGVVARKQILALGGRPHDIRRLVRRRDLVPLHRGVFVDRTGELHWMQHAWAAVLATAEFEKDDIEPHGSGLSHGSALRIAEGPGRRDAEELPIHVVIGATRRIAPPTGVVVHRTRHLGDRLVQSLCPVRTRYEEAILDVACAALDPMASVALISRGVGDRRTTAARLLVTSRRRARVPRRLWLERVLDDVATGSCSVLEHGYLTRVVKPHALPLPGRQRRDVTPIGVVYRDAAYGGVLVELDGRLFHSDVASRDADLDRDLFAAVTGATTIRLGWGQVFEHPCRTAWALGSILPVEAGHAGPRPCGSQCPVGRPVDVEGSGHQVA